MVLSFSDQWDEGSIGTVSHIILHDLGQDSIQDVGVYAIYLSVS